MTSNSTAMMAALFATSHARTSSRTSAARAQLGPADAGAGRHGQQQVLRIDCRQQQRQTQRRTRFHGVDGSHPLGQFCIFAPECGDTLALERNGDRCSCDHYVNPENLLGNILTSPMRQRSPQRPRRPAP